VRIEGVFKWGHCRYRSVSVSLSSRHIGSRIKIWLTEGFWPVGSPWVPATGLIDSTGRKVAVAAMCKETHNTPHPGFLSARRRPRYSSGNQRQFLLHRQLHVPGRRRKRVGHRQKENQGNMRVRIVSHFLLRHWTNLLVSVRPGAPRANASAPSFYRDPLPCQAFR